jgi:ligand-binding SRPBCC domain-containing protein
LRTMLHSLRTTQFIPKDLPTMWAFMSSPENLARITPASMGFEILSDRKDLKHMYQGQIIEYYVSPVLGVKMHWVTEITHVKENEFFVDEQRFGPYSFWHHKHFLKAVDGGVEMEDILHYRLPFGFLGKIVNSLFVKKKIETIFEFRRKKLEELFNQNNG